MSTNAATRYKGFTYQPIIKISKGNDDDERWYEYFIEGRRGKKTCLVKGKGIYKTSEKASIAATKFAKARIDEHLYKYEKSYLYRMICNFGYCPASRYSSQ